MADSQPRFSIQKYENIDYHYVFRIIVDGVTRSWVVPKGPSPDPRVKRLAIPVEDNTEIDFEGIVRDGGKGKVIVWDSGTYYPRDLDGEPLSMAQGLAEGRIDFEIVGAKLQGGFTLLRVDEGANERWLLMKISDRLATQRRNPVVTEPLSVLSGRSVEDVSETSEADD